MIAANFPDQPLTPTLISQSPTAVQFGWTAPNSGGIPITSYSIWYKDAASSANYAMLQTVLPTANSYTYSQVVSGKTYQFKVMATNVVGDSPLSPFI